MAETQLEPSRIDRLIRSILGRFDDSEDSYQDVQLRILERLPKSEAEIKAIAKEVKDSYTRDYLTRKRLLRSLDQPISNNSEEFTFEKVLADPETEEQEEPLNPIPASAGLILDFLVKELVNGKSLNWSILSLLRQPTDLLKRHRRRWEEWEEDILREKYVRGGCLACALFLNRTVNAIAKRAFRLRIRRFPEKPRISHNPNLHGKGRLERKRSKNQRYFESQSVREERLKKKEK